MSFGVMSKKSSSNLMSKIFPILTSNFFIVLCFTFYDPCWVDSCKRKIWDLGQSVFFFVFVSFCFVLPVNAQLFFLLNILSLHCWISFAYCICKYSLYIRILIISYTDWVLKISWLYLCAAISWFSVLFFWSMCLSLHRYHTILITITM